MRSSRPQTLICAAALFVLSTSAGCGGQPAVRPAPLSSPHCEVLSGKVETTRTITVALPGVSDPGFAPWALGPGEPVLFRHLYETLLTVDCLEDVQPRLAVSWRREDRGRRWRFKLREDARFWDGTPVTAHEVAMSWRDALTLDTLVDSVSVEGDGVVGVYLKHPRLRVPRILSSPIFAVAKPSAESRWLMGTGSFRVIESEAVPAFGRKGPVLRFENRGARDARDLLESGIDMMITADPTVIDYATKQPQFTTAALPWDRTYVLLATSRHEALRAGGVLDAMPAGLGDRLARDAVRGDARGHQPPAWWDDLDVCREAYEPLAPGASRPHSSSALRRILYDASDAVARDLSQRIVALADTDPAASRESAALSSAIPGLMDDLPGLIAHGVTAADVARSLRYGDDFAYIVSVPRRPHDPCLEARELLKRAPWLAALGDDFPRALIALVDTRPHVIARTGKFGLNVDWYGRVLITTGDPTER